MLHDRGEEYFIKTATGDLTPVSSFSLGLYNEATDTLVDADDLSAITTEPAGSAYARQLIALPADLTISQVGGDWQFELGGVSFDTSDSSQSVDSYFLVANYQGDGDGSATDHLIASGSLDQTYDFGSVDTFNHNSGGISLT